MKEKDWDKIRELEEYDIYNKILSYPCKGISRSEKHLLCQYLMEINGENIWKDNEGVEK